jgi:hypothetical protein
MPLSGDCARMPRAMSMSSCATPGRSHIVAKITNVKQSTVE